MTEREALIDLISWARHRAPDELKRYLSNLDRKAAARTLLRFRISQDPGCLFDLPVAVIEKLEYTVATELALDRTILDLGKAAKVKFAYAIGGDHA